MALDFGAVTDERYVTFDNLSSANLLKGTVWAWVFPKAVGQSGETSSWIIKSASDVDTSWSFCEQGFDTRKWAVNRTRATVLCQATAGNAGAITDNVWNFVAATWDTAGAAGDQALFHGLLGTRVTEISAYDTQSAGSGTADDITGATLKSGDMPGAGFEHGYNGTIACFGIIEGTILSLAQIQGLQYAPLKSPVAPLILVDYSYPAAGTQPDFSGNGSNGTVTSAIYSANPPLVSTFHSMGIRSSGTATIRNVSNIFKGKLAGSSIKIDSNMYGVR